MEFRLDHAKFESLCAAFKYALREHAEKEHPVYSGEPAFIFRGECGKFQATTPSIARVSGLSRADMLTLAEISDWVAARLHEEREDLTWPQACAYLQHYGMPSQIVDFTGDLGRAFDFAGNGDSDVGRLAVLPYVPSETGPMFKFFDHPWAERAQRQAAFGVLMDPFEITDLKADSVRNRFNTRWYEFAILPQEREWCQQRARALLQEGNDASGGFLRYYITRYVEEFKKLSLPLTDWLLKHIVIAPYCALVASHEGNDAVVFFRGADCLSTDNLPPFDRELEIECSRRYWSEAYNDDSRLRLHDFVMPPPGQMFVDPRTYHSNGGVLSQKGSFVEQPKVLDSCAMKPDTYTKAVLTVIALMLAVIACNQYLTPAASAQAQGRFAGVQFSANEGTFATFDPRTGDVWIYYSHQRYGQMGMEHAKLSAEGGPAILSEVK